MDYISTSLSNTWLCPPPPHFFTVPVNSSQIAELDSAILVTQTSAEEEEVTGVAITVVSTGAESYRIRMHAVDTEDNAAPTSNSSDWMNVVTNGAIGQSGTPVAEASTSVIVVD